MAEDTTQAQEPTAAQEPHGEGQEVDWEVKYKEAVAQSRKWEERSKANKEKADQWDAYQQEGMSEAEKLAQRAEQAESELAALRAEKQHQQDVAEVAEATGVPERLLRYCADRESMEAFAKEYSSETHVPAAPKAPESRVVRGGGAEKASTADQFAEMAQSFFKH